MLNFSIVAQFLLLLILPVLVALWLNYRLGLSWSLFFGGALAFLLAWAVTNFIPVLGELSLLLSSALQVGALYLIYRFYLNVDTKREALMAGVGQGGIEILVIGLFTVLSFVQMLPLRDVTDAKLAELLAESEDISIESVSPERVEELREYVEDYWNTPWYGPWLQVFQSLSLLPVQLVVAILILDVWLGNNLRALVSAVLIHFISRMLPIYGGMLGGPVLWLSISILFAILALWYLRRIWPDIQYVSGA